MYYFEETKKVLDAYFDDELCASPATRLSEDLGCDGIDIDEIATYLETKFDINIEMEEADNWQTVADIANLLEQKLSLYSDVALSNALLRDAVRRKC